MPVFPLRDYQEYAVSCVINHIKYKPDKNGYVKAPGGSGKSMMIAATAEYCHASHQKKVVILTRNEKLLTQNKQKFSSSFEPFIGIYCASLGEKNLKRPITIASIQSIYGEGAILKPDICLIDEIHNLHPDEEGDTQYWKFLRDAGNPQIIGFTATNWRTGSGKLSFGEMIADIPISVLIEKKHIIPPINKVVANPDVSNVQIIRGEYNEGQLEEIYISPALLADSIEILQRYTSYRNSVVIYTQSRKHGKILRTAMEDNGLHAVYVDGETDKGKLHGILSDFEERKFKYLINVSLLVEGWDCPSIDCVCVFLKTLSRGKFEQILYRGTRLAPHLNKENFLVLDMGNNFSAHGALGSPYVERSKKEVEKSQGKICPSCEQFVAPLTRECQDCGYLWPEAEAPKIDHSHKPDTGSRTVFTGNMETYEVSDVRYSEHLNRKNNNRSLRVDYICGFGKYGSVSQWFSPFSESEWAKDKAYRLFSERGHTLGSPIETYSMDDLIFKCQELRKPKLITVDHGGKFPEIKDMQWDLPKEEQPQTDTAELLEGDIIPW